MILVKEIDKSKSIFTIFNLNLSGFCPSQPLQKRGCGLGSLRTKSRTHATFVPNLTTDRNF